MRVSRRTPKGGALACSALLGLAATTWLTGCGLDQHGVAPPRDQISFPASALVDLDPAVGGRWLYVVNSNADLRYNNGTLVAVDLDAARNDRNAAAGTWDLCPSPDYIRPASAQPARFCCWDFLDHTILDCDDRGYIPPASTIEIGSFAAGMVMQAFREPSCPDLPKKDPPATRHACSATCDPPQEGGRLFIGVRGNSSITYTDVSQVQEQVQDDGQGGLIPHFQCPQATDDQSACAITTQPDGSDATKPLMVPDEPYTLSLDTSRDLLYVGHLKGDVSHPQTGGVSLFDVSRGVNGDRPPEFIGPSAPFFSPDANGLFGITSLTPRDNGLIYATSRFGANALGLVTDLTAVTDLATGQLSCSLMSSQATPIQVLPGSDVFTSPLPGGEIRGIQFIPDANRAFMLQRVPPAVIGYDIAMGAGGLFGNVPTDIIETCMAPTFLQKDGVGIDTRLYVTCFESGQVYVIDPFVPRLTNVIDVGRGPAGLAFDDTRQVAYVVGFSASNLSVVDLKPGSPTQFHVIQRIGFPSPTPRTK
jgi:YVTN family beta-propeller protein